MKGMGAKKFDKSFETREIELLGARFCWDIPEVPEEFEKETFVFNFWPLQEDPLELVVVSLGLAKPRLALESVHWVTRDLYTNLLGVPSMFRGTCWHLGFCICNPRA